MRNLLLVLILSSVVFIFCKTKADNLQANLFENSNQLKNAQNVVKNTPIPTTNESSIISNIGNVEVGNNCVRLFIENSQLKTGDKVQIVFPEVPLQKILDSEIIENTECKDDYFGDLVGNKPEAQLTFYLLKLFDKNKNLPGFGIGIVNLDKKIKIEKQLAVIDLDNDKKNEYFRGCTSNEGLHLTVWKGKPLIGKRIWHSYYHFNYDTEPTCKKKDYEGTN